MLKTDGEVQKETVEILSRQDSPRQTYITASLPDIQTVWKGNDEFVASVTLGCRKVFTVDVVAHQIIPVLQLYQRVDHLRVIPHRIKTAHNRPHAGTCNIVDGDAGTFQYLKHTYMYKPFG